MSFLHTWIEELQGIFGGKKIASRRILKEALIIKPHERRFEFASISKGKTAVIGWLSKDDLLADDISFVQSAGLDSEIHQQLKRNKGPVILRVPSDQGMVIEDNLPDIASRDVPGMILHRVDLLSPWSQDQVYVDHRITTIDEKKRMSVDIAIAPKKLVNSLRAALSRKNITINIVDIEEADPWSIPRFDLIGSGHLAESKVGVILPAIILLCAVLAFSGQAFFDFYKLNIQYSDRQDFSRALESRLADLPDLENEVELLRERATYIGLAKAEQPSMTILVEALSRILPKDSWIDQITYGSGQLSMTGHALDVASIPALLEASQHFTEVEFQSSESNVDGIDEDGVPAELELFSIKANVQPMWRLVP